jgi:hypothetical protein
VTHNFTGNVTVDLTSASNGGADYVAPTCNDPPPAAVTEQLPAYTIHASLSSSPVVAPELSWSGAPTMLAVAVMVLLMLLTAGSVAWGANNPPLNVNVSNTPLPVSVTNATTNQSVTVTNPASSPVNTTVTNTATNPVLVSNSDRPIPFNRTVATLGGNRAHVQVPTGCRLVIQVVSFHAAEENPTPHLPFIIVPASPGGSTEEVIFPIATQQVDTHNAVGTAVIPLVVDSPNSFSVGNDVDAVTTTFLSFSISGYLIPLTPGGSCSF